MRRFALPPSLRVLALGAVLATAAACDDNSTPTGLQPADVAGTYTATEFTTTPDGGTAVDQLAAGATFQIVLADDGTTTGHLVIPDPALDEDMAGTWTLNGTTVEFDQTADTFVRDMPFQVSGTTLVGDGTFSGTAIHVVLTRQ